jgi:hypothetical protein
MIAHCALQMPIYNINTNIGAWICKGINVAKHFVSSPIRQTHFYPIKSSNKSTLFYKNQSALSAKPINQLMLSFLHPFSNCFCFVLLQIQKCFIKSTMPYLNRAFNQNPKIQFKKNTNVWLSLFSIQQINIFLLHFMRSKIKVTQWV